MGFLRDALAGKVKLGSLSRRPKPSAPSSDADDDDNNNHRRAHALDTLPCLPSPRRPLTPLPAHLQHLQSPFFTLPAELRHEIYLLLLAPHELHLDMRYTAVHTTTPHSTAGATISSAGRTWRWRASTCHRRPSSHPLADRCAWGGRSPPTACYLFSSPCQIPREALGLLLSCRQAYREVCPVLYGHNTFHISTGALVLYTHRLLPVERAAMVRRLVFRVIDRSAWEYAAEHLGIEPGMGAYRALIGRVPDAFPGLRAVEVVVTGLLRVQTVSGVAVETGEMRACVLEAMDGVVRAYEGRLGREAVLALGAAAFDRFMAGERDEAEEVVEEENGMWMQFWRPVTDEMGYWVRRVADESADELDLQLQALEASLAALESAV